MTYSTEDFAAPGRIGNAWANIADGGFNRKLPDLDILAILRRNLRFIVVIVALVVIATGWWVSRQAPIYMAGAALVIEASDTPSELDTGQSTQGNVSPTTVFTEIEVMRSRDFAAQLAERLDLYNDPRINPAPAAASEPGIFSRALDALGLAPDPVADELSAEVRRERAISNLQSLYAVSGNARHNVIDITSTHQDPVLASRIANGVAGLYMNNTLSKQVASLDRRIKFLTARSEELSGDLSDQQVAMTSLIQDNKLRDDDATRLLLAELTPLQRRLNGLSAGDVRDGIQARVDEIESVLNSRVSAEIELAKQELALQTDMKRFDTVNQRLSELEAQRDAAQSSARQISVAEVPRTPIGPNAPASLAVALVAGTLLASILALFREGMDKRVRSPGQTEAETGLNVIASLPKLSWSTLRQHKKPHAVMAANAYPAFSQAVRSLVTAVDARGEEGGRFVFVGSPLSAEGKSSIATSMAVAAAMDDLKVLLIDFDVHRGGATAALNMEPGKKTVGTVLSDIKELEEAIAPTPYQGVDFLNFRHGSRFSRKVVNQKGVSNSLDALRKRYDMVIFDTPPYLISEESNRLGRLSDVAILVSRWGRTDRATLTQTAQRMQRNGLNVAGVVVNGVEPRRAEVYGYVDYAAYDYVKRA